MAQTVILIDMPEGAPSNENIKSRKEVLRLLQRKIGAYAELDVDPKLPEKYKVGKQNTTAALNHLVQNYVNKQQPLPQDWNDFTTSKTPFYFFRKDAGVLVSNIEPYYFATPTEFINALQKFYKLNQLTVAEVAAELEAAKAAEAAKEKADMEAIRSGEWVKTRMPESLEPKTPDSLRITPRRPSAFRPHG
jgi:ribosome-binding ATPase YchF (GTP1/OBG family)